MYPAIPPSIYLRKQKLKDICFKHHVQCSITYNKDMDVT